MGYKNCYLCKFWSESTGMCSVHNVRKSETDHCPSLQLIPCCASCRHWDKNPDYFDQGVCHLYGGLTPASAICREDNYLKN